MDLGKHLQEALLAFHLGPLDKDEILEPRKASLLGVHLVPLLGSYQLGIGQEGMLDLVAEDMLREEEHQDIQGCKREGRQGWEDLLEDLIYIKAHRHTYSSEHLDHTIKS